MWYDSLIRMILKSPFHGFLSRGILLLTYQGRRSGKSYSIPVSYVKDKEDLLIVSLRNRTWWRNLAGGEEVHYRLAGRNYAGLATVAVDDTGKLISDLSTYLKGMRDLARRLGVTFGEDGEPNPDEVRQVAAKRVMVRIKPENR